MLTTVDRTFEGAPEAAVKAAAMSSAGTRLGRSIEEQVAAEAAMWGQCAAHGARGVRLRTAGGARYRRWHVTRGTHMNA